MMLWKGNRQVKLFATGLTPGNKIRYPNVDFRGYSIIKCSDV